MNLRKYERERAADAVLEDALRMAGLPEARVRLLVRLARLPGRAPQERCSACNCDLATRKVVRQVRAPITQTNGVAGVTFAKRVAMKPAQLVVSLRVEGSLGLTPEWNARVARRAWRFCAACADSLAGDTKEGT